jgi:hypothetical protein
MIAIARQEERRTEAEDCHSQVEEGMDAKDCHSLVGEWQKIVAAREEKG